MVFVRFNGDNIWEIVPSGNYIMTCYKREYGKNAWKMDGKFDYDLNEENIGKDDPNNMRNFNYSDWKSFYGEERLKKIAANYEQEKSSLPLIYFMKYIMQFNDDSKMERLSSTRWVFRK